MSREADPYPHYTAQLQATRHCLPSSTTNAIPKSPRMMCGFVGRGGGSSRMAPPSMPSHQPGHHQRSSPTSSNILQQQQPQLEYPTVLVDSTDERYSRCWMVDDGQSPSGFGVVQQQQQITGYPAQQYQSPAQANWYGSRTQPTDASIPPLRQPPYGYPSTSAGPSYSQHPRPTHVPTRDSSMYAAPIPTAPSQWTSGSSAQGQEPYSYQSGPVAYPQPVQMQPYRRPPYILPTRSNENKRRLVPKPYQRPTPATRKTRPVTYEGNLIRLQQRCRRQGADERAIELLGKVFTNEVSLKALTRPLTDAEVETNELGIETGRVYVAFLETGNEDEGVGTYYVCRLCHSEQIWRHHKDVLRHLRRDHFGLADDCHQCDKKFYTKGEMTRHPCN